MQHSHPYRSLVPGLLLALAATLALAAEPPAEPAPDKAAEAAPDKAAEAETAQSSRSVSSPPDSSVIASAMGSERLLLGSGADEFAVFVRQMRNGPARGVLVMLPGDGQHPGVAPGIEQLANVLPDHGWASWIVALEAAPRVHALRLEAATPVSATKAETAPAADAGAPPAADATPEVAPAETLLQQQSEELRKWANTSAARIALAVEAAMKDGKVVLMAENTSAVLLRRYLLEETPAVAQLKAVILIEPVVIPSIHADWSKGMRTPVLELLTPATRAEYGLALRQDASRRELRYYRQATAMMDGWQPGVAETLLSRTVRGWLAKLPKK